MRRTRKREDVSQGKLVSESMMVQGVGSRRSLLCASVSVLYFTFFYKFCYIHVLFHSVSVYSDFVFLFIKIVDWFLR